MSLRISVLHDYRVGVERLKRVSERVDDALRSATSGGVGIMARSMREEIPKRTGRTASTIRSGEVRREPGRYVASAYTGDEVASYLEYGTRPHVIKPRNARFLRFTIGSRVVFARRVNHPGTRANLWLERAGERGEAAVRGVYEAEIARAIEAA